MLTKGIYVNEEQVVIVGRSSDKPLKIIRVQIANVEARLTGEIQVEGRVKDGVLHFTKIGVLDVDVSLELQTFTSNVIGGKNFAGDIEGKEGNSCLHRARVGSAQSLLCWLLTRHRKGKQTHRLVRKRVGKNFVKPGKTRHKVQRKRDVQINSTTQQEQNQEAEIFGCDSRKESQKKRPRGRDLFLDSLGIKQQQQQFDKEKKEGTVIYHTRKDHSHTKVKILNTFKMVNEDATNTSTPKTETPITQYQCPKLKTTNYTVWAIQIKVILEAHGFWKTTEPKEDTKIDTKKDKATTALLYQALTEDMILQIAGCKTAKELWESLKKRHVGEEKVLMIGFNTLQMKDDDTMDAFTAKLNGYATKAKKLGKTLDESLLVRKLLDSTPDRFIQIVASIEQTSDLDNITLDEITGKLKAFDEMIKLQKGGQVESQDNLLFAQGEHSGKGR
nr:zinc finger, CCHC-type [Tanacetum cinerariifolium]